MERYTSCFKSSSALHKAGCPVVVSAAALLKDNQNGIVLAQTKLHNISDRSISRIKLSLFPTDFSGNSLGEPVEQLMDNLALESNASSGGKQPVILPDELSRGLGICVSSVEFADGSLWENDDALPFMPVEAQKNPEEFFGSKELADCFYRELGSSALIPEEGDDFWRCTCGSVNALCSEKCAGCGAERADVFYKISEDGLKEAISRHADEEEEREIQDILRRERAVKNRRKLKKLSVISVVLAAVALILVYLGIPGICYGMGLIKMNSSAYDEAIDWYSKAEELAHTERFFDAQYMADKGVHMRHAEDCMAAADYPAAAELYYSVEEDALAKNAYYVMGNSKNAEGLYLEAVEAYKLAGKYSDSDAQILKNYYLEAESCFEKGDFENALNYFILASGYENAAAREDDARYEYAKQLSAKGSNLEAAKQFEMLAGYKDSKQLWQENLYAAAATLHSEGDYKAASDYYNELGSYSDSAEKYKESFYALGCQYIEMGKFKDAVDTFMELSDYNDSLDKLNESMYGYVLEHKSNTDKNTYNYLKILKDINYKDSSSLYNDIYAWKLTVTGINNSAYDSTTTLTSISKWNTVYVHLKLSGGVPGDSMRLQCVWTLPNGYGGNFWFDGTLSSGDSVYSYHWYDQPAYGSSGTFTAKYYDGNGNYLATATIYMS